MSDRFKGDVEHAKQMLRSTLEVPGNIGDVAKWAIQYVKLTDMAATLEVVYGGIVLHIRGYDTIKSVTDYFEHECAKRHPAFRDQVANAA